MHDTKVDLTIGSFEDFWNKVSSVGMMERDDRKFELVRQL